MKDKKRSDAHHLIREHGQYWFRLKSHSLVAESRVVTSLVQSNSEYFNWKKKSEHMNENENDFAYRWEDEWWLIKQNKCLLSDSAWNMPFQYSPYQLQKPSMIIATSIILSMYLHAKKL